MWVRTGWQCPATPQPHGGSSIHPQRLDDKRAGQEAGREAAR